MYIDKDSRGRYSLQDMTVEDAFALKKMIEGASLEERRMFHPVLVHLRQEPLF